MATKGRKPASIRRWGVTRPRGELWQIDVYIGAERVRQSFPTKALAEEALLALQRRKALGRLGIPALTAAGITYQRIGEQVETSMASANYTAATLNTYRRGLTRVLEHWAEREVARTTRPDVEEWIRDLRAQGLAPISINLLLIMLNKVHRWAVEAEILEAPPCRLPRLLEGDRKPGPATSEDALDRMLAAAKTPRVRAALLLAADAGLRKDELRRLEADDVDLLASRIRVLGKGRKLRYLPIPTRRLRLAIEAVLAAHGASGRLLGCGSATSLYRLVRPAWEAAYGKGRHPRFHDLRRRFVTRALDAPDAVADNVRRLAGHRSLATTDRYNQERPAPVPESVRISLEGPREAPAGHQPVTVPDPPN